MAKKLPPINLMLFNALALAGSLWMGYQLRFDFAVPPDAERSYPLVFLWVLVFKLMSLWRFGQFHVLLSHFSIPDFCRLMWACFVSSVIIFAVSTQAGSDYSPPRGVVLADFSF